jgi:hypothetical protein
MINYPVSLVKTFLVFLILAAKVACVAQPAPSGAVSIDQFGAQAENPNFDNGPAIIKAFQSAKAVLIPAKNYYISSTIRVDGLDGLTIYATGATITNTNYDVGTLIFGKCSNIKIIGGHYTRNVMPTKQDGKNQHTIQFGDCYVVSVTKAHIERSPEMGICNNGVNGGTYTSNTIEHCLRDGIYAHYSVNLMYGGNTINDIKDDGLSIHDYGIDAQKTFIKKYGFTQGGHSVISGNHVTNCVEGISSVAGAYITIQNNVIENTVIAGISLFNSEDMLPGSTARLNHITVKNNTISNAEADLTVDGFLIKSNSWFSSGRSAIFIGSVKAGQSYTVSKMRCADITVTGNTVMNCVQNGATLYNIDSLVFSNNTFTNCHSTGNAATGNIIEIQNCTNIQVAGNQVADTRSSVLHNRGYAINNSSGTFQQGIVKGYRVEAVSIKNSPDLSSN